MSQASSNDLAAQITATTTKMDAMHAELSGSINELRTEMCTEINGLRTELRAEIRNLGMQIEQTNTNVQTILEVLVPMHKDVEQLKGDMAEVKNDIRVMKQAITATNADVQNHEIRITRLETKSA